MALNLSYPTLILSGSQVAPVVATVVQSIPAGQPFTPASLTKMITLVMAVDYPGSDVVVQEATVYNVLQKMLRGRELLGAFIPVDGRNYSAYCRPDGVLVTPLLERYQQALNPAVAEKVADLPVDVPKVAQDLLGVLNAVGVTVTPNVMQDPIKAVSTALTDLYVPKKTHEHLEKLVEDMKKRRNVEITTVAGGRCAYCDFEVREGTDETIVRDIREHEAECPHNPLVVRTQNLEQDKDDLIKKVGTLEAEKTSLLVIVSDLRTEIDTRSELLQATNSLLQTREAQVLELQQTPETGETAEPAKAMSIPQEAITQAFVRALDKDNCRPGRVVAPGFAFEADFISTTMLRIPQRVQPAAGYQTNLAVSTHDLLVLLAWTGPETIDGLQQSELFPAFCCDPTSK